VSVVMFAVRFSTETSVVPSGEVADRCIDCGLYTAQGAPDGGCDGTCVAPALFYSKRSVKS
jgi:hypothetical protein